MLQIIPNEERLELFESDFPKLKHELEVQHIEIMMQLRENENIIEELLNSNKMLSDLNEKMKVKELELANKNNQLQSSLQKNIDKEHFISILAHDLKAPLNTVIGFLGLLTENVDEYDINTFKTQLNIINKSAKNLDNLLESILMWGISESGRLAFNPQENCLFDLFFDVRELFEKMAEEKGIKITASIHQAETVFADSEMLKTIMRNLISNAIKFTDRGGSIKIKANQVESNLMITISDNGVGMTSSNQKKTV